LTAEVDKGRYTGEGSTLAPVQDVSLAGCKGGNKINGSEKEDYREHLAQKRRVLVKDLRMYKTREAMN